RAGVEWDEGRKRARAGGWALPSPAEAQLGFGHSLVPTLPLAPHIGGAGIERTQPFSREHVGKIIGPGGKTIQEIRASSGCKIKISNELLPHNQQAISFSGNPDQVASAMAAIEGLIGGAGEAVVGGMTEVRQLHERENIGKLIGAGGAKIQELRSKSGAKIQISNEKVPMTNFQAVTISGSSEAVQLALAMISETVAEPAPPSVREATAESTPDQTVRVPGNVMGRIIGPSGAVIKSMREKSGEANERPRHLCPPAFSCPITLPSGARIQVSNEVLPGTEDQTVSLWGTEEQIQSECGATARDWFAMQAVTMINTVVATATAEGATQKPACGASAAASSGARSLVCCETSQTYTVSKDIIKRVIGPGGSTIQKVRETSGARVKIGNEPIAGTDNQPLTLSGTEQQATTPAQAALS
ncbi:MAG: hypothetical protein SGPRY_001887, partial [Prymnesium sp.]